MAAVALLLSFLLIRTPEFAFLARAEDADRPPDARVQSMADGTVVPAELWCVAKNNADDGPLQAALDWACGLGGADCRPIQQGGACFEPNDIQFHASYAFNDYYLRNGVSQQACDFGGTAALTSLNPSNTNCRFSSSSSTKNGSFTGSAAGTAAGRGPAGADISGGSIGARWARPPTLAVLLAISAAIA